MDKPTLDYLGGMGFRMYSYILQFRSTTNSNTSHCSCFYYLYWYWGSCKNNSFFLLQNYGKLDIEDTSDSQP